MSARARRAAAASRCILAGTRKSPGASPKRSSTRFRERSRNREKKFDAETQRPGEIHGEHWDESYLRVSAPLRPSVRQENYGKGKIRPQQTTRQYRDDRA